MSFNAYSVGGYGTRIGRGAAGHVLQRQPGNAVCQPADQGSGTGFTSSLETGYPIHLPGWGPGFVLEPEG